ncbi:MAG: hypothetical protein NW216_13485 [Hyphomicrobium sp.]|nr:hypothetical protein [Hyphomicrobium sp.]
MRSALLGLAILSSLSGTSALAQETELDADLANDYPTATRADYIFGCMQVNGNTRLALERCSCSIDVIASILPFAKYSEAETIMAVRQRGGESVAYMNNPTSQKIVHDLKQAQIEGEMRCF